MKNLAYHKPTPEQLEEINQVVLAELKEAGIPAIPNDPKERGEVPAEFDGKYKGFSFARSWYYWRVSGAVPLDVAEELYANSYGVKDVRVVGHCGCPPPKDWANEIEKETGRHIISDEEWGRACELFNPKTLAEYVSESKAGKRASFVISYHIDTQEGLNLFMNTVRKYNLTGTSW